jgi:hypothetical protein
MKSLKELPKFLLYGPGALQENFHRQFKSIWTMGLDCDGHHCAEPNYGDLKPGCYEELHVAFCCVPITMANGQQRFCGSRFGVFSPKGCSIHHFTEYDENKFFQKARKGYSYELPKVFPHLQAGWEMQLICKNRPLTICMAMHQNELHFAQVQNVPGAQNQTQLFHMGKFPSRELLLADVNLEEETSAEDSSTHPASVQKAAEIQAIIHNKNTNPAAFNDPKSYMIYETQKKAIVEAENVVLKEARKAKGRVVAEKAASSKTVNKQKPGPSAKDIKNQRKKKSAGGA